MRYRQVQEWLDLWRELSVTLDQGISDAELARIEADYGFRFPPDLRMLLQEAQPTSHGFVDWRNTHSAGLRGLLAEPREGVMSAIRAGTFWYPRWGERPPDPATALGTAREGLRAAPTLIPFWGGIYVPDDPAEEDNPLFAVHDADIVLIAEALYDLARRSRSGRWHGEDVGRTRYIPLWSDYVVWPEPWR